MKEVSGKTWVQKAVFLEPNALFSSAFTMCSRGWYLCIELRMICKTIDAKVRNPKKKRDKPQLSDTLQQEQTSASASISSEKGKFTF